MARVNNTPFIILLFICFDAHTEQRLNDPTRPKINISNLEQQEVVVNPNSSQRLTAIFMKKNIKNVIINNAFYKEGDLVGDKKIIAIKSNRVILKNSRGISQLHLTQPIRKQQTLK